MDKPKVIFLDAVGTLFGIRGSVGEVYSALALQAGVQVSSQLLDEAFRQSFKAAPAPTFPGVPLEQIPEREFRWWEAIAQSTFTQAGVLSQFPDWETFFHQLYFYFATAAPWYIYDDVLPALNHWQQQGIELGIISNFDTRLNQVLEHLQLEDFFASVTLSSIVGSAKPTPDIFLAALNKHHGIRDQAWHIGDSQKEDYNGAKQAGLTPWLLERPHVTLQQFADQALRQN